MSGHSKWANIQHRKGIVDKKRSEVFTKLARNILTALRQGSDVALRSAIDRAREANMPKENIERLLANFEQRRANLQTYWLEGFGVGGVAIMVEVETDNKNRILTDVRLIFRDHGGNLGEEGSVGFLFDKLVEIEVEDLSDEKQLELIDLGVKEIEGNKFWVETGMEVGKLGLKVVSSQIVMRPKTKIKTGSSQEVDDLVLALEENDEVVNVYTNQE